MYLRFENSSAFYKYGRWKDYQKVLLDVNLKSLSAPKLS